MIGGGQVEARETVLCAVDTVSLQLQVIEHVG